MYYMKKCIILFLLAFMSNSLSAQTPVKDEKGDYWYTIDSYGNATLVKHPFNNDGYTGDVVIPDVMTSGGVEYKVTGIGYRAFCGCKILSVKIGNNVTSWGSMLFPIVQWPQRLLAENMISCMTILLSL